MQSSSLGRYHQDQGDKPIRVYLKESLAVAPPYSRAVCCTVLVIVEYDVIFLQLQLEPCSCRNMTSYSTITSTVQHTALE
jgi:hypothetical protein